MPLEQAELRALHSASASDTISHPETFGDDIGAAEFAVLEEWRTAAETSLPAELWPPPWPDAQPGGRIGTALRVWAERCHKAGGSDRLHTASPFNVKIESLTLRNFNQAETTELLLQHTRETGQRFDPLALARVFELTQGQPWLVNALARQLVMMAFLHRVINGGGSIQREYAIGTRRMDLCVRHGETVMGIELKVWQPKKADPLAEGLKQLDEYLEGLVQDHGWLVIFDRRPRKLALAKRQSARQIKSPGGRKITVIRA